jgi:cyclopropane fatty-acyl-phospholipid synthase-like methyltransferase
MPMGARVLDLCSGDGFYAYYFYRHRASEITCIEIGLTQHQQAVRLHSAANITHVNASILEYELRENHYDVVTIRGAIEHFSEEAQQVLFKKVRNALKPGGWFCGDTIANPNKNNSKLLNAHEFEWVDEKQMRDVLMRAFPLTETMVFASTNRTALLWQSMKEIAV